MRRSAVLAAVLGVLAVLLVGPDASASVVGCSPGSHSTITMKTEPATVDPAQPSVKEGRTSFTGQLTCTGSDGFICGGRRCGLSITASVYLLVPAGPDYGACLLGIASGNPTACASVDPSKLGKLERIAWPAPLLNSAFGVCLFCNQVSATVGFPNIAQVGTNTPAGSVTIPGIYEVESTFRVNLLNTEKRYGQWIVTGLSDPVPVPGCDGSDASRTKDNCLK